MRQEIEFGFVAALEREVAGLVRGWETVAELRGKKVLVEGNAALICAGVGSARARSAAEVMVEKFSPKVLVSVGFVGSCATGHAVGDVVVPSVVVDAKSGREFACAFGSGRLVTVGGVAGKAMKRDAASRFGALALDMEAAGVAEAAANAGLPFAAIKVVSDDADDDLEYLGKFVKPEGFETGRFIAHIALRPGLWPGVAALQRNSKLASTALESAVREYMRDAQAFAAKHTAAAAQV